VLVDVPHWEIRLSGSPSVRVAGRARESDLPGRQGRLLFAYLVLNRERACSRAELVDVLWPERPPAAAESALSALLSKLRRALGEGVLSGRGELRLRLGDDVTVDVEASEAAVARAEAANEAGRFADAAREAASALEPDLLTFLPDCSGLWVTERRTEHEGLRLRALEALALAGAGQGGREIGPAEQAARAAVAAAPFRESAHRALMEVHEAAGNHAEALRAFEDLRVLLRDELGTMPGPAAMAVHQRLLNGEPRTHAAPPGERVTWPQPLDSAVHRHGLVGRADELAFLASQWAEAAAGSRRLVLVAGDAGIGKTRCAAELAQRAHADGAVVLFGRFDEQTLAPYQPVVEMLRGWSAGEPLDALRPALGARAGELGNLLPEFGADDLPATGAPDARRLRFFDAMAALIAEVAGPAPLVVVLEDVHWADRPTLQLLRHLLRAPRPRRVLYLATYRDAEVEPDHPLCELIGDLRRDGALERLALAGLAEPEVEELVAALGAHDAAPAFLHALHGETEGNPFFIEEVVGHLRHAGERLGTAVALQEAGVPDGVREVTSRRLRRLDADASQVVTLGAVVGREFDFGLLERVGRDAGGVTGDALVAALEAAVDARVIREAGAIGRYTFTHALVRATLYDGLSQLRRARMHARVGEALVALHGEDAEAYLSQLAHHFALASPVERPERAVDFALAAARRADRLLAWEEAAQHYRAALEALEHAGATDEHVRGDLLVALGDSEERAGLEERAIATFGEAADLARGLGAAELLGRAALGYAGPWSRLGRVDVRTVELLEEGLAALGEEETPLRARLLARLGLELYYAGAPERRLELTAEALALARRVGDARALASALVARHYALWRPETVGDRLEVAAELRRVAEETGDPELELEGAGWTVVDLLELGDVAGADVQIAAASKLAEALHQPLYLWWTSGFHCARAQLDGDFDEAERLATETLETGRRGQAENAMHYYAQAIFNIRREQGRLGEIEDAVRQFVALYPAIPSWRVGLAFLLTELGRMDEARELFESLSAADLPRDANWLIGVTLLAEVCGVLRDASRAGELYALLEPYAGRNVVVGRAATCNGSASRLLGILAAVREQWDLAEGHFSDALEMHVRMGTRPWQARTLVAWAEMLLARGAPGDAARARELLADAVELAEAVGMGALGQRARAAV
jgi:DNA-binding SARP family transcriptional activator/tetratricopeptide (TPR) repeat protein